VTEAKGVRRTLSLGTEKLDDTYRITEDTENTEVQPITRKENGNISLSPEKITDIIDKISGTDTTLAESIR